MNARKRLASDTLLPVRAAKIPRTTELRADSSGENASPSQFMGIAARWAEQARSTWVLIQDTFRAVIFSEHRPSARRSFIHAHPTHSCSDTAEPSDALPEHQHLPTPPPPPPPSAPPLKSRSTKGSMPPPSDELRPPPPRHRPSKQPSLLSAPSQSSVSQSELRRHVEKTGLPSPPTTNSTVSSSEFSGSLTGYPEVDAAMERATREKSWEAGSQMPKEREHIFSRQVRTLISWCRHCSQAMGCSIRRSRGKNGITRSTE